MVSLCGTVNGREASACPEVQHSLEIGARALLARATPVVGTKQIRAVHHRHARATLAVASNFAARTDGKLALAYRAQALELRVVIPDIFEFHSPQIPRSLGQLHARKYISIRRNVTTVVAGAARQVFVSPAFDSARNGAL